MPDDPDQYPMPLDSPAIGPRQITPDDLLQQELALLHRVRALEADRATCREVLAEVKIVRQHCLQLHIELTGLRKQCEGLAAMLTQLAKSHAG